MKMIINVSIMVAGVVVVDFDTPEDGKASVVSEMDFPYITAQVFEGPSDSPEDVQRVKEDDALKKVAVLRLVARAHERWQGAVAQEVEILGVPEVKKGEVN